MNSKTNFSMQITQTQKEIMDFVTDVVHDGMYSKSGLVMELFRNHAYGYIGLPDDMNLSDEILLTTLYDRKKEKDFDIIRFVGVQNYEKMIVEYKEKNNITEVQPMELLLKEFKEKYVDNRED